MVGSVIRLGRVSAGTSFGIDYHFTRATKEVVGYETRINSSNWRLPLTLKQAYLGATEDFPLFLES